MKDFDFFGLDKGNLDFFEDGKIKSFECLPKEALTLTRENDEILGGIIIIAQ